MTGARVTRVVTVPLVIGWHLLVVATSPLTLPAAALAGTVTRSTRPLRTVALLVAYAVLELVALARVARLRASDAAGGDRDADWQLLVQWVVGTGYAALRRILGVQVRLEDGSATVDDVAASDGVIVLARHCGPGDTLLVAWLLVVHYRQRLSLVLKSLLRVVPTIDLAGDMLPFHFIGADRAAARAGIAALAGALSSGQALLLFPEGGNFSRKRWVAALRRLAASRERIRARRLRRNEHTLPPRVGGVAAALTAAPQASVLLLAHTGLAVDGRDRPWWRLPIDQDMTVRTLLVPAARVPRDPAVIGGWLDEAWTQIDTWVDGHVALTSLAATPPGVPDAAEDSPDRTRRADPRAAPDRP